MLLEWLWNNAFVMCCVVILKIDIGYFAFCWEDTLFEFHKGMLFCGILIGRLLEWLWNNAFVMVLCSNIEN